MPKWLVRLKAERFDLEDLPKLLRLPEVRVVEENGSFYLESSEFNSLTSAEEVRERGRALIKLVNGVAKFNRDNFLGISEDVTIRVEDDGKRKGYIYLEEAIKITNSYTDGSKKILLNPAPLSPCSK